MQVNATLGLIRSRDGESVADLGGSCCDDVYVALRLMSVIPVAVCICQTLERRVSRIRCVKVRSCLGHDDSPLAWMSDAEDLMV